MKEQFRDKGPSLAMRRIETDEDVAEGLQAFRDKRKPQWRGR